jgi:hypothetical protein
MSDSVITLESAAAGPSRILALGMALLVVVGSLLILPSLFYLIYSFRKKSFHHDTGIVNIVAEDLGKTQL